jgi:hypothetical protein
MAYTLGKCGKGKDCRFEHSKQLNKIAEKMLKKGGAGHSAKGATEPAWHKPAGEAATKRCHHCGRANHAAGDCKHREAECSKCTRKGHVAKICPGDTTCENCNRRGHLASVCYRPAQEVVTDSAHAGKGSSKGKGKKGGPSAKAKGHGKGDVIIISAAATKGKGNTDYLKAQNCRSWVKNGKCDYKDGKAKCLRKHAADLKGKGATTACEMLLAGNCRFGKDCIYNHSMKKKANASFGSFHVGDSDHTSKNADSCAAEARQEARIEERVLAAIEKQMMAHGDPDKVVRESDHE